MSAPREFTGLSIADPMPSRVKSSAWWSPNALAIVIEPTGVPPYIPTEPQPARCGGPEA